MLVSYVGDYYSQELVFTRIQFENHTLDQFGHDVSNVMNKSDDNTIIASNALFATFVRAEKLITIERITETIGKVNFFNYFPLITSDSAFRMMSIGRDELQTPVQLKNLYLLQLGFIVGGVMIPVNAACTSILLKRLASKV